MSPRSLLRSLPAAAFLLAHFSPTAIGGHGIAEVIIGGGHEFFALNVGPDTMRTIVDARILAETHKSNLKQNNHERLYVKLIKRTLMMLLHHRPFQ